jgi:hypothetical protein
MAKKSLSCDVNLDYPTLTRANRGGGTWDPHYRPKIGFLVHFYRYLTAGPLLQAKFPVPLPPLCRAVENRRTYRTEY